VLYVDDKFPQHPKLLKAGARLGANGGAQALALYMYGLAYAREHLTDGFVPDRIAASCGLVQTPQAVISALISRSVRLWHRVPGGYLIHDYLDWNPKASAVREKREKWRQKKAGQRRKGNGQYHNVSPGDSAGALRRDSRAPVPRSTKNKKACTNRVLPICLRTRTACVLTDAARRDARNGETKTNAERPDVPGALRDGPRRVPPGDRRQRMGGADQAPTRRAVLRLSEAPRDHQRPASGGTGAAAGGTAATCACPVQAEASRSCSARWTDVAALVCRGGVHIDPRARSRGAA
jgi:hypothetical protein